MDGMLNPNQRHELGATVFSIDIGLGLVQADDFLP